MISVILITRDEERNVRRCLESVAWADEIVVLDSGSTDGTVSICREFTDKVEITDWPGFGPQKNRALDRATGEWILSIDADEEISADLREELLDIARNPNASACWLVPRLSSYCGRLMRHGGWYPDYVLRFFRRGEGRFSDDLVHEKFLPTSTPSKARHDLLHFPMETLDEAIEKMNRYSDLAAREKHARGQRGSIVQGVLRGIWTFLRTYLFKAGFLDGRQGFLLATTNAGGTFLKYAKLAMMSQSAGQR